MELTKVERLFLSNQLKILEKLYPEEAEYYAKDRKAIEEGYALHYEQAAQHIYDELSEADCTEVIDILDMYSALTFSFNSLEDKSGIDPRLIKFEGFDGNEKDESKRLQYVKYFIHDLERFDELKDNSQFPDYNSHRLSLGMYRRMLEEWRSCEEQYELKKDDIIRILNARRSSR